MEGYCLKDKKKVIMANPEFIQMKNAKPALRGKCPNCGANIYKIGLPDEAYYREEDALALKILGEEYFY